MIGSDLHPLYQQMGELLSRVQSVNDLIRVQQSQTEKLQDLMRADVIALRRDHRNLEERLDRVIRVMQHDMQNLQDGDSAHGRAVNDLALAVRGLQEPVAGMIALRSKAAGLALGAWIIGSALIWLAEPFYRWVVDIHYIKR